MYHQVCEVYFTSDFIKDMKIDLRNKWRKAISLKLNNRLDTRCYRGLMRELDTSSIYQDLQIRNSQIWISAHDDFDE